MTETPTERDWQVLDDALSDMEWTQRQAQATMQTTTQQLEALKSWRHPIMWARLRWNLRRLHRAVGV